MKVKTFLKENSYMMVRLFLNQIAMSLFSIMMVTFRVLANSPFVDFIVGLFCVIFYLFVQYVTIWQEGAKDRVKVDTGREERQPRKGLRIALGANSVNILLVILSTVGRLTGNGYLCVATPIIALTHAMYSSFITMYSPNNPIGHVLILFPAILIIYAGYELGYRNIRIGKYFGIKERKKDR